MTSRTSGIRHRIRPGHEHRVQFHPGLRARPSGTSARRGRRPWRSRRNSRDELPMQAGVPTGSRLPSVTRYPIAKQLPHWIEEKAESPWHRPSPERPRARIVSRRMSVRQCQITRWLSTVAESASAQTRTSVCALRGSSLTSARAMSRTASARGLQHREPRGPFRRVGRGLLDGPRRDGVDSLLQRRGWRAGRASPASTTSTGGRAAPSSSIPASAGAIETRAVDHLLTGVRECDEMAGEIATVDRRYVLRLERIACFVSYQL